MALTIDLAESMSGPLRYLNLGDGFGILTPTANEPLDLASVAGSLSTLLEARIRPELPEARAVIELGLHGRRCVACTSLGSWNRKVSRGHTFLVVDGGLHHQLAASGNFGQVIRRNYPVASAIARSKPTTTKSRSWPSLHPARHPCRQRAPAPSRRRRPGAVFQPGAYGLTASPTPCLDAGTGRGAGLGSPIREEGGWS